MAESGFEPRDQTLVLWRFPGTTLVKTDFGLDYLCQFYGPDRSRASTGVSSASCGAQDEKAGPSLDWTTRTCVSGF